MSCSKTYATLRIFHEDLDPDRVTSLFGVQPTNSHRLGDSRPAPGTAPFRTGNWSLTSSHLGSLDVRDHLTYLLDIAEGFSDGLAQLRTEGARVDVFCYWATSNGQGGPELDPEHMSRLAALHLTIRFDCYYLGRSSNPENNPQQA